MLGVNVFAAPTDAEAELLATSMKQSFLNLRRGRPGLLPPPDPDFSDKISPGEARMLQETLSFSAIGGPETVSRRLAQIVAATQADELMIAANIHDHALRVRSYRITAGLRESLAA